MNSQPLVTIIVVPRERFSCTQESLESIYQYTEIPFKLLYVDGKSPNKIKQYLEEKSKVKNFEIIRTNCYLTPNKARNLGIEAVDTKYIVFFDNDVIVTKGWLKNLVKCAEETNAAIVGPLMCQEKPLHETVHFAGGESHIWVDNKGRRRIREKMYMQGQKVNNVLPKLKRTETELAEFHCVLVRRNIFEQVGLLDEAFMNTKEHLDFCMLVREKGEKVYFEPSCLVTYTYGEALEFSDLHFYMLRWSDRWLLASLKRMREKWDIVEDGYFQAKYKQMGWRRYGAIIEPLVKRLTFGMGNHFITRAIAWLDHPFNNFLTQRHAHQQGQLSSNKSNYF
ncbi:glycosyltransferase family 2 protein [Crocosphaera sp.]|uniref:glycosyltransferase family 2 protein n=1 Tax=Crocosphaera sp. TaxID=2729996 RepID=UPI003F244528